MTAIADQVAIAMTTSATDTNAGRRPERRGPATGGEIAPWQ